MEQSSQKPFYYVMQSKLVYQKFLQLWSSLKRLKQRQNFHKLQEKIYPEYHILVKWLYSSKVDHSLYKDKIKKDIITNLAQKAQHLIYLFVHIQQYQFIQSIHELINELNQRIQFEQTLKFKQNNYQQSQEMMAKNQNHAKQNVNYYSGSNNPSQSNRVVHVNHKNSFCISNQQNGNMNKKNKQKYLSVTSALNNSFDGHHQYHDQSHNAKNNNSNSRLSQSNKYKSLNNNVLKSSNRNLTSNNHNHQEKSFLLPQTQSITQMIDLLTQYQKVCQQKMDLPKAEQARRKINELKKQELTTRRKQLQQSQIQSVNRTNRQTKQQAKNFNVFWNDKIDQAIKTLKQLQKDHIDQQFQHFDCFLAELKDQQTPRVKYSSKVLQTRKNLSSLIKGRKYKQAQHLKQILQKIQKQQVQKWEIAFEQKKKIRVKDFKKKQQIQLQAFRQKLTSSFNELIQQKEKQQVRMLKNIRKKEIESAKVPNYLLRAKTNLLNESKARLNEAQ